MAPPLVIVESPAKARTLARLLPGFTVRASMGHVRDLPQGRLGVDPDRGFAVEYEVLPARRRALAELCAAAREAEAVYLAADPDREGEAICWHLAEMLGPGARHARFRRVAFHEITARAVEEAFRAPREIDARTVDAQQARRILDRLTGYSLSPLLWERVGTGLSAGRVQSVALRLVCEREREIEAFAAEESWALEVRLDAGEPPVFMATLVEIGGAPARPRTAAEAEQVRAELARARFEVAAVAQSERLRAAPPPFTTATLQQEAFRRLRLGVKKAMQIAQKLYEGVELGAEGPIALITYVRTDSTRVASAATAAGREHVARTFGAEYVPAAPNAFPPRRGAQDAHEAIRPTDLSRTPASLERLLDREALALYRLVFDRFLASTMAEARYDETWVEIHARSAETGAPAPYVLRAKASRPGFPGFLAALPDRAEGEEPPPGDVGQPGGPLPALRAGQPLAPVAVEAKQRFTQPPPRFSEASLVKELERRGVGRPSTYASILTTILARAYVSRERGRLRPTRLGLTVTDLLVAHFPGLMSPGFTAAMEDDLDAIAEGRATLIASLTEFWRRLQAELAAARRAIAAPRPPPRTPGSTRAHEAGVACPRCHEGQVVERRGKAGLFFGCSRFPACRFTSSHRPLPESCPECGAAQLFQKETKREGRLVYCAGEGCHFHRAG